ncbi:replication protein [Paenibacillus thailandensis]|uniref:Replication protein n=1 Tax=Paenibacillus thailandensis TaxID=393250 RepID=A0ABW5R2P5_9BACL
MARPQKENGYTPVAHEILDEICQYAFNGAQLRLVIKIWRMTYGFSRKDHEFSITFLAANTLLSERTVKKELAALIKAKVLVVTKRASRTSSRKLAFNKNYEEWIIKKSGDSVVSNNSSPVNEVHDTSPNNVDYQVHDTSPNNVDYQVHDTSPHEGNDTSPSRVTLGGTILPPDKEKDLLKKIYKEKEISFETFWSIYPRRVSKQAALKAWNKLSKDKDFDPELVIRNTVHFAETHKLLQTKPNFILHASTYLNQKRYEDYPTVDPEGIAAAGESKFDSNLDFFKQQLGGGGHDTGPSNPALGEGFGRLPE